MRSSMSLLWSCRATSGRIPKTTISNHRFPIATPRSTPAVTLRQANGLRQPFFRRYQSSDAAGGSARPLTDRASDPATEAEHAAQNAARRADEPAYKITFTCKPCGHRSSHYMSKHGYHKGTVLIACPSCKNRHIISDHLGIFTDKRTTLEDILRQKGMEVTRGYLDGDTEIWEDGAIYKTGKGEVLPDGPGSANNNSAQGGQDGSGKSS
ncbi:hypothetical protein VTN31DRAFT_2524 [Thermomyces dupontii]|uniref:uncharacterized protein n=1 Tax=Talaromyces thermophilus TaxID=28565 RepID=UPI0037429164